MKNIDNGIIVSVDDNEIKYHLRCPNCGYVEEHRTRHISAIHGVYDNMSCPKCKCRIKVNVYGY